MTPTMNTTDEKGSILKNRTYLSNDRLTKTVITYGLRRIGEQKPYFTITGEIWRRDDPTTRFPKEPETCDAIHEHILDVAPEMKPLVDLHLADDDGVPMYAVENGWYFFEMADDDPYMPASMRGMTATERAGKITRIEPRTLETITTKEEFRNIVESSKLKYAEEARRAIETFELYENEQMTSTAKKKIDSTRDLD